MRVKLSIDPDVSPISKEQRDRLPYKPDDYFRSQVIYYSPEVDDSDGVVKFLYNFIPLKEEFEAAFGCGFQSFIYFEGEGVVYLNRFILEELVKFNINCPSTLELPYEMFGWRVCVSL